ncbi:MAG: signal peptidase I [Calothrix sp. FI2-JRJ7]|nr:signal peptidase I [Calothrix sp. FI2-JRJ7]
MQSSHNKVIFGNAKQEGASRGGWFVGHFINPPDDARYSEEVEVKWAVHFEGDNRSEWAVNNEATTLSILINGRFRLEFEDRKIVLSCEGDYVLWRPGVSHTWEAESDCTILTVRWPSKAGDSVAK